jgi:hypothetical protein
MAGQVILSVAYGIDVRLEGDPFVKDAENVLHAIILGSKPEATLFDTITWCNLYHFLLLRYLLMHRAVLHMPSWFPGARFKRCARKWRPVIDNALQTPYDKVKGELVSFSSVSPWCLAARPSGFVLLTECVIPHSAY